METAQEIRAKAEGDVRMRDALAARLKELFPPGHRLGHLRDHAHAAFDTLDSRSLHDKVLAAEQENAQIAVRALLPSIRAAQNAPLANALVPTWPVVNAMAATARAAGPALMRYFNTRAFDFKPFLVKTADPAADVEGILRAGLRVLAPEMPVLAPRNAERMQHRNLADPQGQFWLIDPLDGAHRFVRNAADFTINLALVRNGRVALGVVYAPALDRLYKAIPHQRIATVVTPHRERHIAVRTRPPEKRRLMTARANAAPDMQAAFMAANAVQTTIRQDSALALCRMAEGHADLYAAFTARPEWSVAAPAAVLQAAGGVIGLIDAADGALPAFGNRRAGFAMPPLAAAAGADILKMP